MKRMSVILLLLWILSGCRATPSVQISDYIHNGAPCYEIKTPAATYYLEKAAGGFASMIDKDGNDWIAFSKTENPTYPAGAANEFRGFPNMVHKGNDGGCGHPGFDKCISKKISENKIQVKSKSGLWQWSYNFYKDYAQLVIEKTDTSRNYWILYEGPVAGAFNPQNQYWGTNVDGRRDDQPSMISGKTEFGSWQWAFFGDKKVPRAFFMAQKVDDGITDCFAYLGNDQTSDIQSKDGMVVFGFGREKKATPLLRDSGNVFVFGFFEKKIDDDLSQNQISSYINEIIQTDN